MFISCHSNVFNNTNSILVFDFIYVSIHRVSTNVLNVPIRTLSHHWLVLKLSSLIANFTMKSMYFKVTAELE